MSIVVTFRLDSITEKLNWTVFSDLHKLWNTFFFCISFRWQNNKISELYIILVNILYHHHAFLSFRQMSAGRDEKYWFATTNVSRMKRWVLKTLLSFNLICGLVNVYNICFVTKSIKIKQPHIWAFIFRWTPFGKNSFCKN